MNKTELAHTLIDEYLEAINYTHSCKSDSEQLRSSCDWCNGNKRHKGDGIASITEIGQRNCLQH